MLVNQPFVLLKSPTFEITFMLKNLDLFLSNRLEILYHHLKCSLFGSETTPFMRRLVVVYGPAMKTWVMLRMAQDPELKVATGIEFIYLNQAFETLLKLSSGKNDKHLPTLLELTLAIENELMAIIQNFNNFNRDEQSDWEPFIHYLKLDPSHLGPTFRLSRKMEKRLISLSQHLARLFQDYGRYGRQMVFQWELPSFAGWQAQLWRKLFGEKMGWSYPARSLKGAESPSIPFNVHFFSISFMTACEFAFLNSLAEHVSINYYLLSPCAVFWSDIRSDRETAYLQTYWQQKLGSSSSKILKLEEFLRDRNPLLANFGRLGREMAYQIEESQAQTYAHYVLPQHVQTLNEEVCTSDDLYFTETKEPLTLLHAVQGDLLMMRNPQGLPPFDFEEEPGSVQLHIAPNRRREVQILYHNLLGLIAKDSTLHPGDIIVMAPQIGDYVPYIHSIFGNDKSQLNLQILDLDMRMQSEIVQGFLQLFHLCESRWDAVKLLQLFEHPSFQRRHQLTTSDYTIIQDWVKQAGILWGDDWLHRNELLHLRHCEQGMVEETAVGTWDYGLFRLLLGLTTIADSRSDLSFEVPPCSMVDFSQGELLGKWIRLLQSLRDDLSPLQDRSCMTMEDWTNYLICLLENYFQPNFEGIQSQEDYENLKAQFEILRNSTRFFKEALFPFASIKSHLCSLLEHRGMTYREDHVQAVRFCSLMPLRSIPARIIVILGMQEGAFPRSSLHSSLNLMVKSENIDYCPTSTDFDRYLFLEALHSAQDYFILSCQGFGQYDGKELQPSLLVEEFFSYLDKYYTIQGSKVSQRCLFKHPLDLFDGRYFEKVRGLNNYSLHDYRTAATNCKNGKSSPYSFLREFTCIVLPQPLFIKHQDQIDIKNLNAVARDPIKFHLNKGVEIYLQNREDRKLKVEEDLMISSLDEYWLRHFALKEPLDILLSKAEKEGKLPFGLFKTVATKRLKEKVDDIHARLKKHSVDPAHIFEIEFTTNCSDPIQIEEDRWLFPAPMLSDDNGRKLSIVGKLSHVTPQGLLVLSKGELADVWKAWPSFLLYCYAAKLCPQKLEKQLILVHAAQPKKAFFEDPEPYLKQFIHYYSLCLQKFSPLLPDWIPLILKEDVQGLQDKMKRVFSDSFGGYQNDCLQWILNRNRLPSSETMIEQWKGHAELLLKDLNQAWYPSKSERLAGAYETI
jgi:exodeoxyribonuclease V gamma subunit